MTERLHRRPQVLATLQRQRAEGVPQVSQRDPLVVGHPRTGCREALAVLMRKQPGVQRHPLLPQLNQLRSNELRAANDAFVAILRELFRKEENEFALGALCDLGRRFQYPLQRQRLKLLVPQAAVQRGQRLRVGASHTRVLDLHLVELTQPALQNTGSVVGAGLLLALWIISDLRGLRQGVAGEARCVQPATSDLEPPEECLLLSADRLPSCLSTAPRLPSTLRDVSDNHVICDGSSVGVSAEDAEEVVAPLVGNRADLFVRDSFRTRQISMLQ